MGLRNAFENLSTESKQDTGNSFLEKIYKILFGWVGNLGQKTSNQSAPVVIASDQSPLEVIVGSYPDHPLNVNNGSDYTMYGALNVSQLQDHISVLFSSTAELNAQTISLAANGGSEVITSSNLVINTGTNTNGVGGRRSKSRLLYDPGHEARSYFTTLYTPTISGCKQQHGLMTEDYNNGAYFENDGSGFYIVHKRAGSEIAKLDSLSWNGNILTEYTSNGRVVPFDDASRSNGRVYKIRFGYLGYLGIEYWVYCPDGNPVLIHRIKYEDTIPLFTDLNLYIVQKATKTSGSSNVIMKSGSWEAGIFGEPVDPVISSINSTESALTAGATFTGGWQAIGGNECIQITIATNQLSASNGILIAFSDRGDSGATVGPYFIRICPINSTRSMFILFV